MQVHTLEVEEDINRVLFGLSAPPPAPEHGQKQRKEHATAGFDGHLCASLRQHVLTEGGSKEQAADIADMLGSLRLL